ncbi:MAG TPA: FAD-dependent oxidoreductase [Ignavibacteriaceae bacterium]|nr:FAD-dependent oxidoreductase [Ignavibacteriaceae bacterium]
MYNVVIIGGMAAGCKAAARLSRLSKNYQITIVEKSPLISFSRCGLPLYASGELNDLAALTSTSYGIVRDEKYFNDVKGIKVLTGTEVKLIDPRKKEIECFSLVNHELFNLMYDYLIISTGSKITAPSFSICESDFISSFYSPADAKKFRELVQKGEINKAVIIGAGFIGCELAESLTSLWGIETILIEKEKTILPGCLDKEMAAYAESAIKSDKVMPLLSTSVEKIERDQMGHPRVILDNGQKISSDYVFYCPGVKPDTDLAQMADIKTGRFGGILVDEQMRTSVPDIWAAGDCVEIKNFVTGEPEHFSYGSLANRMGRVAADSIAGRKTTFNGSSGTFSLKFFDTIISAVGLSEKKAAGHGYITGSVIGCWSDRPDFHPQAKNLVCKLVYEKPGLKLLGIQIIGEGEVTRYTDVFSNLLADKKNIYDLINLEHGYTPAHSSPISVLNNLGYMTLNQELEGIINFNPLRFPKFKGICVDVRETEEINNYPFTENTLQIPLPEIRTRLFDLKNNIGTAQPLLIICEKGPRSYEAAKILMNNGFNNAAYLAGGHFFYDKISRSSAFGLYEIENKEMFDVSMEKSYEG